MKKDLVVITWDGKCQPFGLVRFDAAPDFELVALCYNGEPESRPEGVRLLAHKTEFKGHTFTVLIEKLREVEAEIAPDEIGYVAFVDDDIEIAISGINTMLADARAHGYGLFSASLTPDSPHSHARFISRPGSHKRVLEWVEVMAPFMRWEILRAAAPVIKGNISSYGIDQFVMPMLQKLLGLPHAVLYDSVAMRHTRAITSGARAYSNGLTAAQERVLQRRRCLNHVRAVRPDLVGSAWWFSWAAPWNAPLRFLAPRLWQPLAMLRSGLRRLSGPPASP